MESPKTENIPTGCYIDGHQGHYGQTILLTIAGGLGWPEYGDDVLSLVGKYGENMGAVSDDDMAEIVDLGDSALAWLNEHRAAENHFWEWRDGELFYDKTQTCDGQGTGIGPDGYYQCAGCEACE